MFSAAMGRVSSGMCHPGRRPFGPITQPGDVDRARRSACAKSRNEPISVDFPQLFGPTRTFKWVRRSEKSVRARYPVICTRDIETRPFTVIGDRRHCHQPLSSKPISNTCFQALRRTVHVSVVLVLDEKYVGSHPLRHL